MEINGPFPQRHPNHTQESVSKKYFENCLPRDWVVDKPTDYGIDLIVYPVITGYIVGLKFVVQLKSKQDVDGKLAIGLKKSTLNYLFNGSDPAMVVLYDDATHQAYWKWLLPGDFDLTQAQDSFSIRFDESQNLAMINWDEISQHVQRVFKVKNRLLTSLEYDLFNTVSELEAKAWSHFISKQFAEAALYFKRLIDQSEIAVAWLVALAQCLYEEYDYRNALITINKACQHDTASGILLTKGSILAEDGFRNNDKRKILDANKIFAQLFQQAPSEENAYNFANTLSRLQMRQEAIAMYQHALQLNPNSAQTWKNLGQVYYDLKDHVREIECYDKALMIDPSLLQARICRAITKGFVYNEYAPSISTIIECLTESDLIVAEFPNAYYYLGLFLWRMSSTTEALTWLTSGLDNHPGHSWLLSLKAKILYEVICGDNPAQWTNEAIAFFSGNYEVYPRDGVNFYYLCKAVAIDSDTDRSAEMALDWLNRYVFTEFTTPVQPHELNNKLALLIVLQYEIVGSYLCQQPMNKIALQLGNPDNEGADALLRVFHIKRISFLAQAAECWRLTKEEGAQAGDLIGLFRTHFLSIDPVLLGQLIKTPKGEEEDFLVEVTHVVSNISGICGREAVRCIAYAMNYLQLEEPVELDKFEFLAQLYAEADIFYSERVEHISILQLSRTIR